MKKLLTLVSLITLVQLAFAQEEATFMHYTFNKVLLNPAASGFDQQNHNIFMHIRSSWSGFPGAPRTYALGYDGPIGKRIGIGAMVWSENIGAQNFTRAQLTYAFRYDFNDVKMSAGFSTQFNRTRIDEEGLDNASIYDQGDQLLLLAMDGEKIFDAALGIHGTYRENVHFGLALPSLIRTRLDEIEGESAGGGLNYFILYGGGKLLLDKNQITLEPSVAIKRLRNVPFHIDFNLVASFLKERLITGLTYRAGMEGNMGLMLGTKYNALRFVYTYDVSLGDFQRYNGGSHELTINFAFSRAEGKFDRSKKYRKQ